MSEFRIEKDSLGELQVPADALYGAQTQRAVLNFPITGMRPYPAFIWSMAAIKRAAAEVNHDLGLFKDRQIDGKTITGGAIVKAIVEAHGGRVGVASSGQNQGSTFTITLG